MCGIVGYIGKRKAWPILVEGLKRLEYRGYDSAGAALMSDTHQLNVYKSVGKVADLERTAEGQDVSGCVGIAHTRWATHGEPSTVNAIRIAARTVIWHWYTTGLSKIMLC